MVHLVKLILPLSQIEGSAVSLNNLSDVSVSSNQITFGSADTTAILPADDNGVSLGSTNFSFAELTSKVQFMLVH